MDEELKKLQEIKFERMVAIQAEEDKIKENQTKGYQGKFQEEH